VNSSKAAAPSINPVDEKRTFRPQFYRRVLTMVWRLSCILLILLVLFPIRFDSLRVLEVATVAFVWGVGLFLLWNRRPVRYPLLALGVVALLALAGPGRRDNPSEFRTDYVKALDNYNGVTYIWGGETRLGVDCSGLMRCAYVDTCYRRGFLTANPGLIRAGLSMWWNDRSAKAISEGYRGETTALFDVRSINSLDHARIQPGDMAVTSGGLHVMAYLGGGEWMEADPKEGKVVRAHIPENKISWFTLGVTIVRWSSLNSR